MIATVTQAARAINTAVLEMLFMVVPLRSYASVSTLPYGMYVKKIPTERGRVEKRYLVLWFSPLLFNQYNTVIIIYNSALFVW